MKIGKVDYKKMALNALEEDWISEQLVTATAKISEAISALETQAKTVENEYEEARKSVAHLEGKTSLSEDEYFELEGTLGWMESYFEDAQLQIASLSQGLIIVASNFMKQMLANAKGVYWYSRLTPDNNGTLMALGPQIHTVFWADALNAASNYVRHSDEWKVTEYRKITLTDGSTAFQEIQNVIQELSRSDSKKNARTIEALGIPAKKFLVHKHDISRELVRVLGLDDGKKLNSLFSQWQIAVSNFVKSKV